jgi:hypothetical protein
MQAFFFELLKSQFGNCIFKSNKKQQIHRKEIKIIIKISISYNNKTIKFLSELIKNFNNNISKKNILN